jgi:hypothetical protein
VEAELSRSASASKLGSNKQPPRVHTPTWRQWRLLLRGLRRQPPPRVLLLLLRQCQRGVIAACGGDAAAAACCMACRTQQEQPLRERQLWWCVVCGRGIEQPGRGEWVCRTLRECTSW